MRTAIVGRRLVVGAWVLCSLAAFASGCTEERRANENSSDSDADTDSDLDAGADGGADTDVDTDTDIDTDTDADTDPDGGPNVALPMTDCAGGRLDPDSNLCWQNPPYDETVPLADAVTYCENLILGGFDNWRLPMVQELYMLARGCLDGVATDDLTTMDCAVTDPDCLEFECFDELSCWGCPWGRISRISALSFQQVDITSDLRQNSYAFWTISQLGEPAH